MINYKWCPACKSAEIEPLESYESFPAILWPIEAPKRHAVSVAPIRSWLCRQCYHVFLNDIDEDFSKKLYEDYYYLYPFKNLESLQAPYREAFDRIAGLFLTKTGGTLLEVGCDDVGQMQPFLERGLRCSAINPGARGDEPVRFIDGFYGDKIIEESFEYVVARFNLEHIVDMERFFFALERNLSENGLAIIQVPNAQVLAKAGMLNILAHEHPHYFCRQSVEAIVRRHGYEILYLSQSDEASLISVFSRSKARYDPRSFKQGRTALSAFGPFMKQFAGRKVFIYGVSMSLTGLLYSKMIDPKQFDAVTIIDDNSLLHGKFMPLTDLKIEPVDAVGLEPDSIVLLSLNPIYHPMVIERLNRFGVAKNIFAMSDCGLCKVSTTTRSSDAV